MKKTDTPDMVNQPPHYKLYPVEVIDMMAKIWGREKTRLYCIMNAYKYRMRIGLKDEIKTDLAKEQWYLNKAKELA